MLSCTEEGMCGRLGDFIFWEILPSISLYVWFLEGFDHIWYILHIYTTIFFRQKQVCSMMFNERNYCITNTEQTSENIYHIYLTHKVLKSCRNKMTTLAHDVCDVHGGSSLYIKTCWQSLYKVFLTGGIDDSFHQPKICSFIPSPPNFYSLPPKVNSTQ